jgi:hypothetical protein
MATENKAVIGDGLMGSDTAQVAVLHRAVNSFQKYWEMTLSNICGEFYENTASIFRDATAGVSEQFLSLPRRQRILWVFIFHLPIILW